MIALVNQWQTLITGFLAILAALIGGHYINRQIQSAAELETERRKRKFAACRAVLPLTLSALSQYAERCNSHLKDILATRQDQTIPQQNTPTPPPPPPASVVPELQSLIELADALAAQPIVRLVGALQVQVANLSSLARRLQRRPDNAELVVSTNIEDYMIRTAEIYARCASLFDFARGETEDLPGNPTLANIRSALNQTGIWQDNFAALHQRAAHFYPN